MAIDCIFCKIVDGTIPSEKVYEDEMVVAFHDLAPVAPVHILIIPKKHISSILEIEADDGVYIAHIYFAAKQIAKEIGIAEEGFRIVNNCGEDGGQTVYHIHFHLIGGRKLTWPPG